MNAMADARVVRHAVIVARCGISNHSAVRLTRVTAAHCTSQPADSDVPVLGGLNSLTVRIA
jgi:hypothetical protein